MSSPKEISSPDEGKAKSKLSGWYRIIAFVAAVSLSVFQVYTAAFGLLNPQGQRGIHYAFILFLLFFFFPAIKGARSGGSVPWYDILLALVGVAINLYPVVYFIQIALRAGEFTNLDGYISFAIMLITFEATRRVMGWPLVIISALFVVYARFGYLIPGYFGHRGFDILTISTHSVLSMEGIMGIPLAVASTFVFIFVLFSCFLRITGLGQFFINLAVSLVGHVRGGPAQVAVLSSGLLGTISGSAIANVVGTGTFTIPLMKSIGYKPHFAGAIEAAASTGGQLMPPIMGAAAFVMSEFLGIPYLKIALAASIPALLYYLALGIMVDKEAVRTGMKGIPRSECPRFMKLMKENGHLVIPLVIILYVLLMGYTPLYAGLTGVISCVAISFLRRSTRIGLRAFLTAMREGAEDSILISAACGCCGIIVGVVTLTGVGLKLGYGLVNLAGGSLFFTLVLTMITSMILGMGLPTTACYIITVAVAAPALIILKVPPLAAHMFAFYFGIIASLTPPVCITAYTGAAIAKADPIATAIESTRLSIVAFLIPYFFVYNPYLLFIEFDPLKTLIVIITSLIGTVALGTAVSGFWRIDLKIWERVFLLIGALSLLDPKWSTDLAGLGLMLVVRTAVYYREIKYSTIEKRREMDKNLFTKILSLLIKKVTG